MKSISLISAYYAVNGYDETLNAVDFGKGNYTASAELRHPRSLGRRTVLLIDDTGLTIRVHQDGGSADGSVKALIEDGYLTSAAVMRANQFESLGAAGVYRLIEEALAFKEAYARVFAETLNQHGINAHAGSRLD